VEPREENFNQEFDVEMAERGDLVEGTVLRADVDGLWLDIASKYDAFLPLEECTTELARQVQEGNVPTSVEVVVTRTNDERIYLSFSEESCLQETLERCRRMGKERRA